MFDFRLINLPDGNQIVDRSLKTPYDSLTLSQMEEYIEMDNQLYYLDRMERKQKRETEKQWKITKNPLLKLAGICGIL